MMLLCMLARSHLCPPYGLVPKLLITSESALVTDIVQEQQTVT